MPDELTLSALAGCVGEPQDRVREWRSLRLIGREGRETFGPEDVQRARLVQLLMRRGLGLAAIARANDEEAFLARYMDLAFPEGVGPTCSLSEAAERLGLDSRPPGASVRCREQASRATCFTKSTCAR